MITNVKVQDESSRLREVILGTAVSLGGTPTETQAYDARSKESIRLGIYPSEDNLIRQMNAFEMVLDKHGVKVHKPDLLTDCNQVYTRDIGFVIGDQFVFPNIISDREHEKEGIEKYLNQMPSDQVILMPMGARAEGGDVIVWRDKVFVGYSKKEDFDLYYVSRTNVEGLEFLKNTFGDYEVHGFELNKSDSEPRESALHLDCCFQPVGKDQCIIAEKGFKHKKDFDMLVDIFGRENCIMLSPEEMYDMNSNIFSISPDTVVTDVSFERLNDELLKRGFILEKIEYHEVRKMGGLFRCSTLPLRRE